MDAASVTSSSEDSSSPCSRHDGQSFIQLPSEFNSPQDFPLDDLKCQKFTSMSTHGKGKGRPQFIYRKETCEGIFSDDIQNNHTMYSTVDGSVEQSQLSDNYDELEKDDEKIFSSSAGKFSTSTIVINSTDSDSKAPKKFDENIDLTAQSQLGSGKIPVLSQSYKDEGCNDYQSTSIDPNVSEQQYLDDSKKNAESYYRCVMARRARIRKKRILKFLQSQNVDIDQYIDEVRQGYKSDYYGHYKIPYKQSVQSSPINIPVNVHTTGDLRSFNPTNSADSLSSSQSLSKANKSSGNSNISLNFQNCDSVSGRPNHHVTQSSDNEDEIYDMIISNTDQQMFQKEDTFAWCHQQVKLSEKNFPGRSREARLKTKNHCLFYETVLADILPIHSSNYTDASEQSYLCLLKDPDRVQSPRLLDELLTILAVVTKVYVVQIMALAQEIEEVEYERLKAARNTHSLKRGLKANENDDQSDHNTRIILSKHIYEAARRLNNFGSTYFY